MADPTLSLAELRSPDVNVRREAAERLAAHPAEARQEATALVAACGDADEHVRTLVASALEDLGPPEVDQLSRLQVLAVAPQGDIAYWAVTLLGRLGPAGGPATRVLADMLNQHPVLAVRQRAAWALGQIGPAAAAARPQLLAASAQSDPRLARLARTALEQLDVSPS